MHTWPHYSESEIAAVGTVLRSGRVNYWTGEQCREFEKEFAAYCNVDHAVALANGTVALELALRVLDIGQGDEVIVPSRTFIASASCVVNCGAHPVFADVDRDSQNISLDTVQAVMTPRTRAIIVVHLAGWPCDMDSILDFASAHNLQVIEDCAQAHGATYKGKAAGSMGHVAAYSFCQDKIMSTGGEGGMLLTSQADIWKKAWAYKDHGKSHDAVYHQFHRPGFRWLHHTFGTNWRMTELQAAIGRLQLEKLPEWHRRRTQHARILTEHLQGISALRIIRPPHYVEHAYYRYQVFIRPALLKNAWNRDRIMMEINAQGIPCSTGPCAEVYLEKAFDGHSARPANRHPVARELGKTGLCFLVHPTLTDDEIEQTCQVVEQVMRKAVKSGNSGRHIYRIVQENYTAMEKE